MLSSPFIVVQGAPVAAIAVAWMLFSITILAFPALPRPDANGMNYMIVVWGGWLALCLVYYAVPRVGGACWFEGPRITLTHPDPGDAGQGVAREKGEEEVEGVHR